MYKETKSLSQQDYLLMTGGHGVTRIRVFQYLHCRYNFFFTHKTNTYLDLCYKVWKRCYVDFYSVYRRREPVVDILIYRQYSQQKGNREFFVSIGNSV